ncbi:unnamed protein product, partial [Didymodactylos carnosus]
SSSNASISDVLDALEMANSVYNIRRFNYVSKVVQLLSKEKLSELSGNAQSAVFKILQQMIDMGMIQLFCNCEY